MNNPVLLQAIQRHRDRRDVAKRQNLVREDQEEAAGRELVSTGANVLRDQMNAWNQRQLAEDQHNKQLEVVKQKRDYELEDRGYDAQQKEDDRKFEMGKTRTSLLSALNMNKEAARLADERDIRRNQWDNQSSAQQRAFQAQQAALQRAHQEKIQGGHDDARLEVARIRAQTAQAASGMKSEELQIRLLAVKTNLEKALLNPVNRAMADQNPGGIQGLQAQYEALSGELNKRHVGAANAAPGNAVMAPQVQRQVAQDDAMLWSGGP